MTIDVTNGKRASSLDPVTKASGSDSLVLLTEDGTKQITRDNLFKEHERRARRDISNDLSNLSLAISEQNLAKYGYAIGDYFESPEARTLKQQSSNTSTETSVNVKLKYHLADMDTYYGGYSNQAVIPTHHVAIVVDTGITRQWHTGDASAVGYSGSTLHTYLKGEVLNAIKADIAALTGDAWSSHLVPHNKLFTTSLTNWGWIDTSTDPNSQYISALSEVDIYGCPIWSGNTYQQGEAVKWLELFQKFRFNLIFGNVPIWLRSMQAASVACDANSGGIAGYYTVTDAWRAAGLILYR